MPIFQKQSWMNFQLMPAAEPPKVGEIIDTQFGKAEVLSIEGEMLECRVGVFENQLQPAGTISIGTVNGKVDHVSVGTGEAA